MNKTAIAWTNVTFNSVHGCSKVSDGCKHCYAAELSLKRGWTHKPWTIQNEAENVLMKPHKLIEPYRDLKPGERIFVNSMSDMFHRQIPDWYIAVNFLIFLDLSENVWQILTKRPEQTVDWHERFQVAIKSPEFVTFRDEAVKNGLRSKYWRRIADALDKTYDSPWGDNIWMGASVEDARVLHRIETLRQNRAKVRFISAEPLLGAWGPNVNLDGIHWVIVGGESGFHMTPENGRWMDQAWAREIRDLCVDQGVAFFMKQDSAKVTETRTYLVEEDGSKWKWFQYPGQFSAPECVSHPGRVYEGRYCPQVIDDEPYAKDYDWPWEAYIPHAMGGIIKNDGTPYPVTREPAPYILPNEVAHQLGLF